MKTRLALPLALILSLSLWAQEIPSAENQAANPIQEPVPEPFPELTQEPETDTETNLLPALSPESPKDSIVETYVVYPAPVKKPLTISGGSQEAVTKQVQNYLKPSNQKWIISSLAASAPYRRYIRARLKQWNMPMDLEFLPVIESNYKITAVSRSGATGMWQFMENSIAGYLKKGDGYDERLDPWRETDAALKKLKANYDMFKDWPIAIAAYNCGAGAMSRILKTYPGKSYWWLANNGKLSKETTTYVTKLLAVADVVRNADYYGALQMGITNIYAVNNSVTPWTYVYFKNSVSFKTIVEKTSITMQELEFLNPHLKNKKTPANERYGLRIPTDKKDELVKAFTVS